MDSLSTGYCRGYCRTPRFIRVTWFGVDGTEAAITEVNDDVLNDLCCVQFFIFIFSFSSTFYMIEIKLLCNLGHLFCNYATMKMIIVRSLSLGNSRGINEMDTTNNCIEDSQGISLQTRSHQTRTPITNEPRRGRRDYYSFISSSDLDKITTNWGNCVQGSFK